MSKLATKGLANQLADFDRVERLLGETSLEYPMQSSLLSPLESPMRSSLHSMLESFLESLESQSPSASSSAVEPTATVPYASTDPNFPMWGPDSPPSMPKPERGKLGASILGPQNPPLELENPALLAPPTSDNGEV